MPKLIIQDNLKLKQPKVIPVEEGVTLLDALKSEFKSLDPQTNSIYLNGALVLHTDSVINKKLNADDVVTVNHEVKGVVESIINIGFGFTKDVVGIVADWLIDTPDAPDTDRSSPNNNYSSQSNVMRSFSQLPVVVGSPVVYPDLAGDAIEFYNDNVKQSEQAFIVSFGDFEGGTVRAGNTNIQRFPAAVATRYNPDPITKIATIPNYRIGKAVDEVDGQIIKGTNEGVDGATYFIAAINDSVPPNSPATYIGTTFTYYTTNLVTAPQNLHNARIAAGGNLSVSVQYNSYSSSGVTSEIGNGSLVDSVLLAAVPGVSPEQWKFTVNSFDGQKSPDDNYNGGSSFDPFITTIKLPAIIGPFSTPIKTEKMFFNIKFSQGLKATVPIRVIAYELDSIGGNRTGFSQPFNVAYTANTLDPTYYTFQVSPSAGRKWYEFTLERTNAALQDTSKPDVPIIEKVYCINELGDFNFYNVTMLTVKMPTTQVPTGNGVDTKINIKGGMTKMPSYDLVTKTITADAPSRSFADAILFIWRDFLEKDVSILNLDELYSLEQAIIAKHGVEFTYFDYTYDDVEQSAGERIDISLNVARCSRYSDGKQIRFWRDEKTSQNATLISRADIVSESERDYSLTRTNYVAGDFDSVQVEYIDRDINKKAYVYRSISGSSFTNVTGSNPRKIVLTGCQSKAVADNRADLEIRKMLYQRWTLSDTVIDAHRLLDKGAVVLYNEIYEGGDAFGGDVVAKNGNTVTTSNPLSLSGNYHAFFTNLYGDVVGPLVVTASTKNTFTVSSLSSEVYARGFEDAQLGSRYFITKVNDSIKRRYRVLEKATSGYNVQLTMIGYDDRIYDAD